MEAGNTLASPKRPVDVVADYLATRGSGKDIWDTPEAREYIAGLRGTGDESTEPGRFSERTGAG